MPSEMKVNKISPASGTAITLGDSGDTFTIPSGATITNNGTQNGFGSTSASDLTSGTLPMARLSGTLPSLNGSALTALNATQLTSGTIPIARIADDAITNAKMADDAIDSAQIVDGAVDLAHMSSQSVDEDNLYISNAGSNGQFLSKQSGNSGGLTWADAGGGGAWTLIGAQNGSNSSSLTQTGMNSSTYKMFCVVMSSIVPASNGSNVQLLLGDSNGIDEAAGDYAYHLQFSNANSSSYGTAKQSTSSSVIQVGVGTGSSLSYGVSAVLYVSHGVGTNAYPMVTGNVTWRDSGNNYVGGSLMAWRHAAITLDRCRIQGGSSINGNLAVYGLNLS